MIRLFAAFTMLWASTATAEVDIQEVTSPGGITAWLVEAHEIPFTALEIRIRGGASLDLPEKRGASNLMTGLLEEGSGDMNAQEFQTELESLAATFSYRIYDDTFSLSARFLTENQDDAIALLRQSIIDPSFDQDAIERVRAQVISGIQSDAKDPDSIASATYDQLAFGDHPYGSSLDGTEDSVNALTRDDLIQAHQRVLTRDRIYVGAVGDITADDLGLLLDTLLGELPATGPELPDRIDYTLAGGTTVVDYETPQSVAIFGHGGITRDDDDFFAAYILNEILGGRGRESRLMKEVREERGLTYGVYSYLVPKDLSEQYLGSLASANETMAEALDVIRAEWTKLAENGVSEQELSDAKTYLTGAYPLRFDGNGPIADIMVGMQMTGLPIDYIATRNDQINAVTLEEINRVAREILDPDGLHFVVVGQPVGLETTAPVNQ
ncbi:M16 family metallopeptidase [Aestuariibius sp. HNIBRBA575]|uniref:M16 family metallopeptidase n=1 Tax=Aestuariibius sp. HNIBRBA575 TaxID=3233343 RepID=UPI0034A3D53A